MPVQLRIPFAVAAGGGISTVTDTAEIDKLNLITLVGTNPGERCMRPTYGVGTREMLFESADGITAQILDNEIRDAAETYAPEISIRSSDVVYAGMQDASDQGIVRIEIGYAPAGGRLNTGVGVVTTIVAVGG